MLTRLSESPGSEAHWLIEEATGLSRGELTAASEIDEASAGRAVALARRRAAGEPLQYITGVAHFRYLDLNVGPGVLIPRPETELVVERTMELLPEGGTIVDVGTGSGAIALAIKHERPDASVWATEASMPALAWAEKNRKATGVDVSLIHCDLFTGLPEELRGSIDLVVSNPPYVASDERDLLPVEVVEHEPHEALFAPGEPTSVIEQVAKDARPWLRGGGWVVFEIGERLGTEVVTLLTGIGYEDVSIRPDLTGRDRIASARLATRSYKER